MADAEEMQSVADSSSSIPNAVHSPNQPEVTAMSKNQLKKRRKFEQKLASRMERRKQERERKKEKRKESIKQGIVLPPCRKELRKLVADPVDITMVIDCSFEQHMIENDIRKLVKQIQHCYAINRRASEPFKYCVSSYGGKVRNIIENLEGTHSWTVKWCDEAYDETFPKENIVYLAAESDNVLSSLEEGKVYVIGGLVDHNSKKGLCYKLATEKGIAHAQLPISNYIDMKCRKVLTIDHVFEILQKFHELKDWKSAFFSVIPKRKGAQGKDSLLSAEVPDELTDAVIADTGSVHTGSAHTGSAHTGNTEIGITDRTIADTASADMTSTPITKSDNKPLDSKLDVTADNKPLEHSS